MRLQENVDEIFKQLRVPIVDSVLIPNIVFTGSTLTQSIPHTLSRQPLGWTLADKTAAVHIYRVSWDVNNIKLTASGAVTISLLVY